MTVMEQDSLEQLESRFRSEKDARLAKRLWMVIQARRGETAQQIADRVGVTARSVQGWIRRYNAEGISGLSDRTGRGRKSPLAAEEEQRFCERWDRGPTPADGVCVFRGKDARRLLREDFGKLLSLSAAYELLHRLGYSCLVPRPKHRRSDPPAQDEFKKNCRLA